MSVNKVILIGNLGADPETHSFSNGGMVANVSLATTEKWSDKQTGERKEATEWHRVVFNNRLAEIAQQYLRKGSKVYIEGSIKTRKWQDQNGQDKYSTEIRALTMQMLDSNPNAGGMGGQMAGQMGGQSHNNQGSNFAGQNGGFQNNSFNNQNQAGYQNQAQPQQQAYQNQGNPNAGNSFNQPPQAPQTQQQPPQAPVNPTAPAMSDAPVDDDIPF